MIEAELVVFTIISPATKTLPALSTSTDHALSLYEQIGLRTHSTPAFATRITRESEPEPPP